MSEHVRVVAPGRVNLIGDHTDHTGGWVLPMAVDFATTIEGERLDEPTVELTSDQAAGTVRIDLASPDRASDPAWARFAGAVATELGRDALGLRAHVTSTVPLGGGLSSSASLLVALALALGADHTDSRGLAELCQRAEHRAVGVPCGLMDPLTSIAGVEGHALLIDTRSAAVDPIALPEGVEVVIIDTGVARRLEGSAYADRRERCVAAAEVVGDLRAVDLDALEVIDDPLVRAAGRHVVGENERVLDAAAALRSGDVVTFGSLMGESHASLRDLLDVSTPEIDALVDELQRTPGVHGARLTGAGFGGWVVALADAGALERGRVVRASDGAAILSG